MQKYRICSVVLGIILMSQWWEPVAVLASQPSMPIKEEVIWSADEQDREQQRAQKDADQAVLDGITELTSVQMSEKSVQYQTVFERTFNQDWVDYQAYFTLGQTFDWAVMTLPEALTNLSHESVCYQALMRGKAQRERQPVISASTPEKQASSRTKPEIKNNSTKLVQQPVQPPVERPVQSTRPKFSRERQQTEPRKSGLTESTTPKSRVSNNPSSTEKVVQVILPEKLSIIGSQQSFIKHIAQSAQIIAANNDLYASVMIAQAALESSWGTSDLSGRHHNLFGIKGGYRGQSIQMWTKEVTNAGVQKHILADFRSYPSVAASLRDYAVVMQQPIFRNAKKSQTNSYQEATAFLTQRYATDPTYGQKLNQIIKTYDLTRYDHAEVPSSAIPKSHHQAPFSKSTVLKHHQQNHSSKGMSATIKKVCFSSAGLIVCLLLKKGLKL